MLPVGGAPAGPTDMAMPAPVIDLSGDMTAPPVCLAGHYVGTYAGQIKIAGLVPLATTGTVDLTLNQNTSGEFLFDISNGKLMGSGSGNPYSADLEGTLNCATLKLENGFLRHGTVTVSGQTYGFEGPLLADYDPKTATFINGTWNVTQTSGPQIFMPDTGMGTWTAMHM
jgi:hypothetical protein